MTQLNTGEEELLKLNPAGFEYVLLILFVFVNFSVHVCVFFCRMQCADILADRDTDGQWAIAKAVFNGTVNGTVTLVRATTAKIFFQKYTFTRKIGTVYIPTHTF